MPGPLVAVDKLPQLAAATDHKMGRHLQATNLLKVWVGFKVELAGEQFDCRVRLDQDDEFNEWYDAHLDEIKDIEHLQEVYMIGTGVPLHILGFGHNVNRDIVEDQRAQFKEDLLTLDGARKDALANAK